MCVLPDVTRLTANVGQYLLLACDGIFDKMTNEQARFVSSWWQTFLSLSRSVAHLQELKCNQFDSNLHRIPVHLFHHDCILIHCACSAF